MMRWPFCRLALLCLSLIMVACTPAPRPDAKVGDVERAWQAHLASLQDYEHWNLVGKVAIRVDDESWHANLQWRQNGERFRLRIIAPFGGGTVQLDGDAQGVTLRGSNIDGVHRAASAEQLLARHLGWSVPLKGLRYWVRGAIQPQPVQQLQLDPHGRLRYLVQDGWAIDYLRYMDQDTPVLPGKVFLKRQDVEVRLVIQRWRRIEG